jgi:hypothetical protein
MAQAIDPASGKLRGDPTPVASSVAVNPTTNSLGAFSASGNGVLAFRRGSVVAEERLVWFDRSGNQRGTVGGVADYTNPALSPDGNRLAVGIRDPATAKRDLWILDLQRETASRFTFDPSDNLNPAWSPDGSRIAFTSDRRGHRDLYVKDASGAGEDELLLASALDKSVEDWSPDGRWIAGGWLGALPICLFSPWKPKTGGFPEQPSDFIADSRRMAISLPLRRIGAPKLHPAISACRQIARSTGGGRDAHWRGVAKNCSIYATRPGPDVAVDIAVKNGAIRRASASSIQCGCRQSQRNRW